MIITTELYDGQGLGNQLWAYATCRSIADQLNLPHRIANIERFKGHSFLDIDEGDTTTIAPVRLFKEELFYDHELDYFSSDFDSRVLGLSDGARIHGLFQSEEYFFGDSDRLSRYVRLKDTYKNKKIIAEDCCVVYIRGGEYKRHRDLILPKSYWLDAMENMTRLYGITDFLVVTDDDAYVKALLPGVPLLTPGAMEDDYAALYQAKYAIIANSSWGYFPVKTGVQKTCIIAPMHWAKFNNKKRRWASPANLYTDWLWQDVDGALVDYAACSNEKIKTIEHYRQNLNVLSSEEHLVKRGFRRHIPAGIRKSVKRYASIFLPKYIG